MNEIQSDYSVLLHIIKSPQNNGHHHPALLRLCVNFRNKHFQRAHQITVNDHFEKLLIALYEPKHQPNEN